MCCGQRRAAARNSPAPSSQQIHSQNVIDSATPGGSPQDGRHRQIVPGRVSPAMQGSRGSVLIRYIEDVAIRVQGPETGRSYEFSGDRPVQPVDARDAVALLNTRHFRRA